MEEKYCKKCETTKPTSEFYLENRSKDGLRFYCKECDKAYMDKLRTPEQKERTQFNHNCRRNRKKLIDAGAGEITMDVYEYFVVMGKSITVKELKSIMPELIKSREKEGFLVKLSEIEKRLGLGPEDYQDNLLKELQEDRKNSSALKLKLSGHKVKRKVNQLTLEGDFVATYNSILDASIALSSDDSCVGTIANCCRGNNMTAKGFIFEYAD